MATLAIVGAGPALGAAVARRFGREGFVIALVSRDQTKLDAMATELADGGGGRARILSRRARCRIPHGGPRLRGRRFGSDHRAAVQPAPVPLVPVGSRRDGEHASPESGSVLGTAAAGWPNGAGDLVADWASLQGGKVSTAIWSSR